MISLRKWIGVGVAANAFVSLAVAQNDLNPKNRQELKREDVAGTNMEIIISVVENQPGETISAGQRGDSACTTRRRSR